MKKTPEPRILRAAIYLRVSTTAQAEEGVSMEYQEERCRQWAQTRGARVVQVYRDDGLSGKDDHRPAYRRMVADLKAGAFDVLVALKIDRLNRDMHDFLELGEVADQHNVDLAFVTQNFDTSTPLGRLMRNLLALFAQFERELIAERVKETMLAAAARGRHVGGRTPFGYRVRKGEGGLEPDPATREFVPELFRLYLSGRNAHDLVKWLRGHGQVLSHSSVLRTLRNPAYVGRQVWSGRVHPAAHEPLLEEGLWQAVQERLDANAGVAGGPRRTAKEHYEYLLDGLLYCGFCGAHLTTHAAHGKSGRRYFYYRCSGTLKARGCTLPPHNAQEVDRYVQEQLSEAGLDADLIRRAMARHDTQAKKDLVRLQEQRRRVEAEATAAGSKIRNLMELAASGEWGPDDVEELKAELAKKRQARESAEARLAAVQKEIRACEQTQRLTEGAEALFRQFIKQMESGSLPQRRAILRAMIQRGTLFPGRIELDLMFGKSISGEHLERCSPDHASGGDRGIRTPGL